MPSRGFHHFAHQERPSNFWRESCLGGMFPAVRGVSSHTRVTRGWLLCVTLTDTSLTGRWCSVGAQGRQGCSLFSWDLAVFPDDLSSWGAQSRIKRSGWLICSVWDEKSLVCCGNNLVEARPGILVFNFSSSPVDLFPLASPQSM